jgi:hypothetical protein
MFQAPGCETIIPSSDLPTSDIIPPRLFHSKNDCIIYLCEKGLPIHIASSICMLFFSMSDEDFEEDYVYPVELAHLSQLSTYLDILFMRFNILYNFGKLTPQGEQTLTPNIVIPYITEGFIEIGIQKKPSSHEEFNNFMQKASQLKSIGIEPSQALTYAYKYCDIFYYYLYDETLLNIFFSKFMTGIQYLLSKQFNIHNAIQIAHGCKFITIINVYLDIMGKDKTHADKFLNDVYLIDYEHLSSFKEDLLAGTHYSSALTKVLIL